MRAEQELSIANIYRFRYLARERLFEEASLFDPNILRLLAHACLLNSIDAHITVVQEISREPGSPSAASEKIENWRGKTKMPLMAADNTSLPIRTNSQSQNTETVMPKDCHAKSMYV
jgi:hypothetical protein